MSNRFKLINDQEEATRLFLEGFQVGIWTALPGRVESVNNDAWTCEVQPSIQAVVVDQDGVESAVELPLLLDVPIVFPKGGGFVITAPLEQGDEVLVVFSSRCIDAWWQSGGIQQAMEARMHDLSDGFAIPGPFSIPEVPEVALNSNQVEIRNKGRTIYFGVGSEKFKMVNADTDLKTVLSDLTSAINGFMTTLAALTPPSTPVLNAVLQVPATTAVAALAAVTVKIDALLEAT